MPLTDAQLAALYPTVQSYVNEFVSVTLDNVNAGYIPRSFTRDPGWYSDIRELIEQYVADGRIKDHVAAKLLDRLDHAEREGMAGSERPAIAHLEQLARSANREITDDTAARDAVLRPTEACPNRHLSASASAGRAWR